MNEHLQELLAGGRPMKKWEIEMQKKDKEINRLKDIFREVREYTNDLIRLQETDYIDLVDKKYIRKYLEILDKVGSESNE